MSIITKHKPSPGPAWSFTGTVALSHYECVLYVQSLSQSDQLALENLYTPVTMWNAACCSFASAQHNPTVINIQQTHCCELTVILATVSAACFNDCLHSQSSKLIYGTDAVSLITYFCIWHVWHFNQIQISMDITSVML